MRKINRKRFEFALRGVRFFFADTQAFNEMTSFA